MVLLSFPLISSFTFAICLTFLPSLLTIAYPFFPSSLPFSFLTTSLSHSLSRQISVQLYFSLSLLRSFLFCHHWYSGQSVSPSLTSPLTSRVLKTEWVRESFEWFVVVVVASMPLSSSECFAGDLNAQRAKAWAPSLCSSRFYFLHSRGSSFEETKHFTLSLSWSHFWTLVHWLSLFGSTHFSRIFT